MDEHSLIKTKGESFPRALHQPHGTFYFKRTLVLFPQVKVTSKKFKCVGSLMSVEGISLIWTENSINFLKEKCTFIV